MKTIKFRGRDIETGKMIYGDLIHAKDELLILEKDKKNAKTVDKNSAAQLVGYDVDGKEIYEGDVCVDKYYCTYREKAGLMATFNNFISGDEDQHFSYYKLREKENEK